MQFDGAQTLSTQLAVVTLLQIVTSAFVPIAQQELSKMGKLQVHVRQKSTFTEWMYTRIGCISRLNKIRILLVPVVNTIIPLFAWS